MQKIHKFLYVGIISTLVDYLLYSFLIYLNISYIVAIIVGYLTGFVVNFIISRKYVFDNIKINNIYYEFLAVFLISVVAIGINIFIIVIPFR